MSTTDKRLEEQLATNTSASGKHKIPPMPGAMPGELYSEWSERMRRGRGRQAAISRNLYTLSNYKNWADKVRGNWETPKSEKDKK
jgi:hypothetical protein